MKLNVIYKSLAIEKGKGEEKSERRKQWRKRNKLVDTEGLTPWPSTFMAKCLPCKELCLPKWTRLKLLEVLIIVKAAS